MDISSIIVLVVIVAVGFYGVTIYNGLVALKHSVSKAWSNIDVLLKQRHDELPKLIEVCKQYMGYEQETLKRVITARSAVSSAREAGDVGKLGAAETLMRKGLGGLFALAENYPELNANENFQHLQDRITSLENSIADRREFYNESGNLNNIRIDQFPDVVIARWFRFDHRELLEFSESETQDVDMKALFN
jgi:LemA protein